MACFVFLFLGGSKDLSIGPEAVLAILTLEITNKGIEYVVLLTFLSGVIILVLAIFRLGKFFGALFFFEV
jgi:MFS superfamily sulfate permease-like transporter